MTLDTLFDDKTTQDDTITIDETKDYLAELVGPGKKFADVKELAKGKWYADQQIDLQNRRADQLREDYLREKNENATKARLEEMITQLAQKQTLASSDTNTNANEDTKQPVIDFKQIEELVAQKISSTQAEQKATTNLQSVESRLQEVWGNNYSRTLKQRSQELGLNEQDVHDLAKRSPQAFYNTFGVNPQQKETFQAPPQSNQRKDSFAPQGEKKRTWSYYQELKKQNPQLYFDPKIGAQMAKDISELGEAFQDGDYWVSGLHDK